MQSKHKIALITGGGRGLGKNMALRIAENQVNVIITYCTNQNAALETAQHIKELGRKCEVLQLDSRNVKSFQNFKKELTKTLETNFQSHTIDFLINNAGFGRHALIADTTEQDFDDLLNVHFKGVYFLTQTLLDIINFNGRIINISSGLSRFSFPGYAAYACMKGAIEVFTRYLAKELGGKKITVNTLAPGAINTDFNRETFENSPTVVDIISSQTALGRVGESDDIGGVVANLCKDDMAWVNGQRIEASGGMFL